MPHFNFLCAIPIISEMCSVDQFDVGRNYIFCFCNLVVFSFEVYRIFIGIAAHRHIRLAYFFLPLSYVSSVSFGCDKTIGGDSVL